MWQHSNAFMWLFADARLRPCFSIMHADNCSLGIVQVIFKRLLIQGFIVGDYMSSVGPQFRKDMSQVGSVLLQYTASHVAFVMCCICNVPRCHFNVLCFIWNKLLPCSFPHGSCALRCASLALSSLSLSNAFGTVHGPVLSTVPDAAATACH